MELKPATRTSVKPIICFYSESGCGKTYSALLLARGFVGPTGKIGMIDTESGRGSLYADVIQGGYDVLQLQEPFSPARAIEAMQAVEKSGAQIGIIDSGSHFWEGLGGVLDMAAENEVKSGKPGLHNWRVPKMEHAKFMLKMLQSSIPWIVCLRAKYKTKQAKNAQGRTEIVKDDHTSPIQAEDFIYESTCHGEIMPDHSFRLTKCSHPSLRQCMPNNEPVKVEHGQMLARWCATPGTAPTQGDPLREAKAVLWELLKPIRGTQKNWGAAEIWLVNQGIIGDTETVSGMTIERLLEVIEKTKEAQEALTPA